MTADPTGQDAGPPPPLVDDVLPVLRDPVALPDPADTPEPVEGDT